MPYVGITNGAFQQNALIGNANTYASSAQSLFYADPQFKNDANAFSKTIIENSPLSRVIQQGSVGTNWQPNEVEPSVANTVKMAYRHNSETDIKKFDFNHDTELWTISTYGANELFVSETKDEKNNKIEEFTNILGQLVCKKVYNTTNNEVLITYNAYDEFGRNRFVLPPLATSKLVGIPNFDFSPKTTPDIKDFIFYYDFDARGRLIEKKTPDAEPEEMVYNPFDQLILVRNALQKSKGIWVYTKYDELGRPFVNGTYTDGRNRADVLADLNASFAVNKYGDASFPTSTLVEKSRTYYDEYPTAVISSMMGVNTPLTATPPSEFSFYGAQACNTCTINLRGKVTATVEQLEIPTGANLSLIQKTSLLSIQYYDEYGRTIQTRSDNHMGKTEISSVKYDFAGRVLETFKTTGDQATDSYKEWNKNTYDKGQRLKMTVQQLSDKLGGIEKVSKAEPVGRYKYNEIGEMIEKWQGCKQQVITTQTNIKGWLLNINGTANPATLKTKKQFFGMELTYDQADGQISQANWGTVPSFAANAQLPGIRGYAYQYDALGRILSGTYNNSTDQNEKFSLSGMSYDLNGNIKTLQRTYKKTINGTTVDVSPDILNYTYAIGNRLKKVDDTGNETGIPADKNPYFKDNNTTEEDYEYDFGGNLIKDKNRKIAITYNYLGLPEKVVYDNTTNIYYVYDASGNKVQKQNAPMPQQGVMVSKTMNYIGNMLFMGNELQQVSTAEGRALPALAPTALVPATSTLTLGYRYEYIQTDYFGNTRTACRCGEKTNETGEIIPTPAGEDAISLVQENHYDPWGLNLSDIESKVASPLNHYQFNGNAEKGFLPNGDFDYETPFRNYNPALGRFMQVDVNAEQAKILNPYRYGFNNPVSYQDPRGDYERLWYTKLVNIFAYRGKGEIVGTEGNYFISNKVLAPNSNSWNPGNYNHIIRDFDKFSLNKFVNNITIESKTSVGVQVAAAVKSRYIFGAGIDISPLSVELMNNQVTFKDGHINTQYITGYKKETTNHNEPTVVENMGMGLVENKIGAELSVLGVGPSIEVGQTQKIAFGVEGSTDVERYIQNSGGIKSLGVEHKNVFVNGEFSRSEKKLKIFDLKLKFIIGYEIQIYKNLK